MLTMRDRYILAQALYLGKKALKAVPAPFTEVSNIRDMERLQEEYFPQFPDALFEPIPAEVLAQLQKASEERVA